MIAMLMSAGAAFFVVVFGTPLLIRRSARARGSASRSATTARSRTPTRPRRGHRRWAASRSSSRPSSDIWSRTSGARASRSQLRAGRCSRSSSASESSASSTTTSACAPAATSDCASGARRSGSFVIAAAFAWLAVSLRAHRHASVVHAPAASRPRQGRAVHLGRVDHLRDGERGEPHRRPRRPRCGLVGVHLRGVHDHCLHGVPPPGDLPRHSRPGARPGDRRGRDVRRVRGVPVVERGARAASSWATRARSRSAARWPGSRS